MKKTLFISLLGILLLTSTISVVGLDAGETTLGTTPIQDLIDAASPGDIIELPAGLYDENIVIDKSITLLGDNKETIIDGGSRDDVIQVNADHVTLKYLTIQGGDYPDVAYRGAGISLYQSSDCVIEDNLIQNSDYGITVTENCNDNVIRNNNLENNLHDGIDLYINCDSNLITDNYISGPYVGIYIRYECDNNYVTRNTVEDALNYGLCVISDVKGNVFHHNTFRNNPHNVKDECDSTWYDINTNEGNYYDSYPWDDVDPQDGIGDLPYLIPGGENFDPYPLGFWNKQPSEPIIEGPANGKTGTEYDYTVSATDADGDDIYFDVQWQEKAQIETYGPYESGEEATLTHTWNKDGQYTITVKVKDWKGREGDSVTLTVTMPKNKCLLDLLLERLTSAFPNVYLLLKNLIKL